MSDVNIITLKQKIIILSPFVSYCSSIAFLKSNLACAMRLFVEQQRTSGDTFNRASCTFIRRNLYTNFKIRSIVFLLIAFFEHFLLAYRLY